MNTSDTGNRISRGAFVPVVPSENYAFVSAPVDNLSRE